MHLFSLIICLLCAPLALSQAVCEGGCSQYDMDSFGRVMCPGTNVFNRLVNQNGNCKRHYELLGGYGCCCDCPAQTQWDYLPCDIKFANSASFSLTINAGLHGTVLTLGSCFSSPEKDRGDSEYCASIGKQAADVANSKYEGVAPFTYVNVEYDSNSKRYVANIYTNIVDLANEGHTTTCACPRPDCWQIISWEKRCTCGYECTTKVRRDYCTDQTAAYQSRCMMVHDNICIGLYPTESNQTMTFTPT
ncbi:hypothetical protein N7456_004806 [Penicillium angulare]|uniref:Uncharacterized protein n=1 Tax=Penicillium angulare TaxID=116970 RepID=A0A9W9FX43_9EURO|nr:hypothetical protein N7456_004806 [Penicillium angulare]